MAKNVAAKGAAKKKNRKLRRQIRKTVGALLMVSAIVVAAIPVPDVSAYPVIDEFGNADSRGPEKVKVAVTNDDYGEFKATDVEYPYETGVPYVRRYGLGEDEVVYTSGDGDFKFVYIQMPNEPNKGAVILNYSGGGDTLKIPDTLEAYRQYTDNYSAGNYCLVSKNNEFLYYERDEQEVEDGQLVYKTDDYIPEVYQDDKGIITPGPTEEIKVLHGNLSQKVEPYQYTYTQKILDRPGGTEIGSRPAVATCSKVTKPHYYPCYYSQEEEWKDYPDNELWYIERKNDSDNYDVADIQRATTEAHWKIVADVKYIGNEGIEEVTEKRTINGEEREIVVGWKLGDPITKPEDGVFANTPQITNLELSKNIKGVGDYAFYGCVTLKSVKFSMELSTLGNGAFANCIQLNNVQLEPNTNLRAIGKDAFYNCQALKSFTINDGLQSIGDCAFEKSGLETINLLGSGEGVILSRIGNHAFRDCAYLSGVEFPPNYAENLDIDMFEGCQRLQFIRTPNSDLNFSCIHANDKNASTDYPNCVHKDEDGKVITDEAENIKWAWDRFRSTVPDSFYFEGPNISQLHTTANNNAVTYKYPNQELYERVEFEHDAEKDGETDPDGRSAQVIYQVDNSGNLVKFAALNDSKPDIITIPETVGAFGITSLNKGSFNDNCYLKKVTIPASVTFIGEEAFMGCHELETVVFTDATTITEIGEDAFRTQVTNCRDPLWTGGEDGKPNLYFVGAMLDSNNNDTVPFRYAMNGSSKVNNDNTEDVWITCHSGWPSALEVQYNEGEAQLVGYPRLMVPKDDDGEPTIDLAIPTSGDWSGCKDPDSTKWTYTNTEEWAIKWVEEHLPFVTGTKEKQEYADIVLNAVRLCEGEQANTTPNIEAFKMAATNIVIPTSVESIEPGLFSGCTVGENGDLVENVDYLSDTNIQSILINGVKKIEPYTFKGCTGLERAEIIGSEQLGDYAFDECEKLENVVLGINLQDTGRRPFRGCGNLTTIGCLEGSRFSYKDGILYRATDNGLEIVECLENRGQRDGGTGSIAVGPEELAGVVTIKPEAFEDCERIRSVDLSNTTVTTIPEGCFRNTTLNTIIFPTSLNVIENEAFKDCNADPTVVYFNSNPFRIEEDAFSPATNEEIIFQCAPGSNPDDYAKKHGFQSEEYVNANFEVSFWNLPNYPSKEGRERIGGVQLVKRGEAAVEPETENLKCNNEAYVFKGWNQPFDNVQSPMEIETMYGIPEYTVTFIDGYTGEIISEVQVIKGGTARPPEIPDHTDENQIFYKWSSEFFDIQSDTRITALYKAADASDYHSVVFYDYDRTTKLYETSVVDGGSVMEPKSPTREGYVFTGWMPPGFTNITSDMAYVATYERAGANGNPNPSGGNGSNGSNGNNGNNGSNGNNGNNNANSSASPRSSASAAPTATPANGDDVVKYTVTVSGGSGTGSYPAGAVVAINAYAMGVGQVFDKWTSSTAGVGFADATATSTTFTMPAANVAVTATYKTGGTGSAATNASGSGSSGGGSSSGTVNNGSTVEVSRPGISNTNLAGATVSGSTDNFIVKISEDQSATDAATSALQARFGDLSRIKYFPMDISLYDSTGRTKIADTSGISVNLTLPLPDELVQYAGNNKMAAISGGALEDLNARFTTVSGVPCINFTATHFSPYVIYVDTANLTEATIDSTPQTGDPIHPKWFLALGMACISLVLFFKRDKVVVKAKAV